MNKCILCTFVRMIWNGLWTNTCPSIDRKKEEKPVNIKKISKEIISTIGISILAIGVAIILVMILEWVGLLNILMTIVMFIFLIVSLISVLFFIFWIAPSMAITWTKERIECIKAYWRKAKEVCE